MKKLLEFLHLDLQSFILYCLSFLFLIIGFTLSFFNLVSFETTEDLVEEVLGTSMFFGEYFNGFILCIFILNVVSLIMIPISLFFKKYIKGITPLLILVVVAGLFLIPNFLNSPGMIGEEFNFEYTTTFIFAAVFEILSCLLLFGAEGKTDVFSVKSMTEIAVLVALALGLNYLKIPLGATGGSINLQIVPLFVIALRYGPAKTFIASGLVYGLLSCVLDGYGLFTFPMEYMIAFGSVMIVSIFRKFIMGKDHFTWYGLLILSGLIIGQTLIRWFAASIDSYVFYLAYLDTPTFGAALIYNAIYVLPTGAINVAVLIVLYIKPLFMINSVLPSQDDLNLKTIKSSEEENSEEKNSEVENQNLEEDSTIENSKETKDNSDKSL